MKKPKGFGSAPKKMAKGGSTKSGGASQSKGGATKGSAPDKKSGGSAAGKSSNTSSVKGGGGGFFSGLGNAVRGAFSGGAGKSATVTDPKTGKSYARPTYGAMSLKGLTSTDPANVARNRAAAQMYAQKAAQDSARNPNRGDGKPFDRESLAPKGPAETPVVAPKPTRVYTSPPAGYRPGIDQEWNYYQPQAAAPSPLATRLRAMGPMLKMAKGGKVTSKPKPKGKKK